MDAHPIAAYRANQTPPLTQTELASQLGVSRATVWRWENGNRIPDKKFLPTLSRLTGTPIAELIGLKEDVA